MFKCIFCLYISIVPSRSEQTFEYTPPEALLNYSWFQGPPSFTLKYVPLMLCSQSHPLKLDFISIFEPTYSGWI